MLVPQETESLAAFLSQDTSVGCELGRGKAAFGVSVAVLHPNLTEQKLYFACIFCSHIHFIFWLCFFRVLWTLGGEGKELPSKISYSKERSVGQKKSKKLDIKEYALQWQVQITLCPPHFPQPLSPLKIKIFSVLDTFKLHGYIWSVNGQEIFYR